GSGTAGGVFDRPQAYYVPGYLAVVIVLTPFSRVGSTVARYRSNRRFEKLATTPLTKIEWVLAHAVVTTVLVGIAVVILLLALIGLAGFSIHVGPGLALFVIVGTVLHVAIGALIGILADSQDGVIAAANGIGIPLVFLAETFLPPETLPTAARPLVALLPLTYFSRGVRAATLNGGSYTGDFAVLLAVTVIAIAIAAARLPWTE
ncbi:MAG: ABC transporter permease, partial [Halobacteriales archaeon]|nr:ABC transporter permease [Halobacteriales archaeon]